MMMVSYVDDSDGDDDDDDGDDDDDDDGYGDLGDGDQIDDYDSNGVTLLYIYLDVVQMVLTAHGIVEIWENFHHQLFVFCWSSGDYRWKSRFKFWCKYGHYFDDSW